MINRRLVRGSLVLLVFFGLYNFLNFVFQINMARMLSLEDYGVLASLFSILYISNIFSESIQTVVVKYSGINEKDSKIKHLLVKFLKRGGVMGLCVFLVYSVVSVFLVEILKINYTLLLLNGVLLIFVFFVPVTRGVLQGKKQFFSLGLNMVSESVIKLALSFVLVFVGWRVYGAIFGAILGSVFSFLFSFYSLRKTLSHKREKSETSGIYKYTAPAFLVNFVIIVFYTVDILIAKIVFDEKTAGAYAIASVLGKAIFWGVLPISKAMFPLASENKTEKNVLRSSLILFIGLVIPAILAFYFFPETIIKIFSGKEVTESSRVLVNVGVANALVALSNLFVLNGLSKGKLKNYSVLPFALLIELIMLFYFSESIYQFSAGFITASACLLLGVLWLTLRNKKSL